MQQCFAQGTRNTPLQVMRNYFIHDNHSHRCLEKVPLKIVSVGTSKSEVEDNSIVTVHEDRLGTTGFYRVHDHHDNSLVVTKIRTSAFQPDSTLGLELPWAKVGVQRIDQEEREKRVISLEDVCGKACIVSNLIVSFNVKWLQSKRCI